MKYVFKTDLDIKVDRAFIDKVYVPTRVILLNALGFKVRSTKVVETKRGYHFYYYIEFPMKLTDEVINMTQLLLGDDVYRVKINQLRIKRGVKNWNKLFSRVVYIKKRKYIECPYCGGKFMIKNDKAYPIGESNDSIS